MNKSKIILEQIALELIAAIPNKWIKAVLNIEVLPGYSSYHGFYFNETNGKESIRVSKFDPSIDDSLIELKTITTTQAPVHKNWNRAIFTLYPNNKFEIEYLWDQELQDDVDGRNNEITPIA